MKPVLVIHEKDLEDKEQIVIGIASSVEKANELIEEYYGDFYEVSFNDIRDSTLEYSKVLEIKDIEKNTYQVVVTTEWFNIDEV